MRNALICLDSFKESEKSEAGVFKNVKILGLQSKNGYAYSVSAIKEAIALYDGVKVYKDHAENHKVDDILGAIKNPKFVDGMGLYGDFHANTEHVQFKQLEWNIHNVPMAMGFSHDAYCARDVNAKVVTKIGSVESVDLVCKPATVNGMFESVQHKEGVVDDAVKAHRFTSILDAVRGLVQDIMWSPESVLGDKEKVAQVIKVYSDGLSELKKLKLDQMEESIKTEEIPMDLTKLTEADLRKDAAELVRTIEAAATQKALAVEKTVADALAQVPAELQSDVFKSQIRESVGDADKIKKLIDDRKAVAQVKINAGVPEVKTQEQQKQPAGAEIKVSDTLALLK